MPKKQKLRSKTAHLSRRADDPTVAADVAERLNEDEARREEVSGQPNDLLFGNGMGTSYFNSLCMAYEVRLDDEDAYIPIIPLGDVRRGKCW